MDEGVEVVDVVSGWRRHWATEAKRRIVEQTLSSSLSVASLARQHGVNANQLFYWRKLYRAGQLGGDECIEQPRKMQLLPVCVDGDEPPEAVPEQSESADRAGCRCHNAKAPLAASTNAVLLHQRLHSLLAHADAFSTRLPPDARPSICPVILCIGCTDVHH